MRKLAVALPLAAAILSGIAPSAYAQARSCVTINGETRCSEGQQSLSCSTVNGRTTCLEGPGRLDCRSINGETTCTASPEPADPTETPNADDEDDFVEEEAIDSEATIHRDGTGLRVRAGGVDIRID
ncbi:MAG: hypothetical protein H3C38_15890 [Rhodospirillales bacterium]|nr:hypothetical protein [Rhodospirillales bacterium]